MKQVSQCCNLQSRISIAGFSFLGYDMLCYAMLCYDGATRWCVFVRSSRLSILDFLCPNRMMPFNETKIKKDRVVLFSLDGADPNVPLLLTNNPTILRECVNGLHLSAWRVKYAQSFSLVQPSRLRSNLPRISLSLSPLSGQQSAQMLTVPFTYPNCWAAMMGTQSNKQDIPPKYDGWWVWCEACVVSIHPSDPTPTATTWFEWKPEK